MGSKDVVSWNTRISEYFHNARRAEESLMLFDQMINVGVGVGPDGATMVLVLPACAHLKILRRGRLVHRIGERKGIITTHTAPRDTYYVASEGLTEYGYSCYTPQVFSWEDFPPLKKLLSMIHEALPGSCFNSLLLNRYQTGSDTVGWHSDDGELYGPTPEIASVSFGCKRVFLLKRKKPIKTLKEGSVLKEQGGSIKIRKDEQHSFTLKHGSMLVMRGNTQKDWLHSLPKSDEIEAVRINLTFRRLSFPSMPKRGSLVSVPAGKQKPTKETKTANEVNPIREVKKTDNEKPIKERKKAGNEKPIEETKKARNEIDEIFSSQKKRKKLEAEAQEAEKRKEDDRRTKAKKMNLKKKSKSSKEDAFHEPPSRERKRTVDGLTIFTEEELGFGKSDAGSSGLCPFDCTCCF
ncbi:hypothetical protein GIB67_011053 [Kingdonia uniflora]|uniref:Fe2OG dioxygenase domain-containing protein n=1 Tax=Kingdonia uniflora TaxID=39325 RepID=A0A7J7L6K2_9MAGN|nr:hypothetical protein GIB67_011053 [Kingdonia uniflora]